MEIDVQLVLRNNGRTVRLKDVLYVPGLCANLISVSQVIKNSNSVVFEDEKCIVYNSRDEIIATASLVDDVYKLDRSVSLPTTEEDKQKKAMAVKKIRTMNVSFV